MKLKFRYQNGAFVLPDTVLSAVQKASDRDLRILLLLAADPLSFVDAKKAIASCAERLSLLPATVEVALSFWRGAGVLLTEADEESPATVHAENTADKPQKSAKKQAASPSDREDKTERTATEGAQDGLNKTTFIPENGLPLYSADELENIIHRRREIQELFTASQQVFGKVFNRAEFSVIAGMADYLGFDGEYILMILSHCRRMGKKSIRYAEKMAIRFHDEGIEDASVLEERLHHVEELAATEGKLRKLFGIGSRSLTTKEKTAIEKWVTVMKFPEDVLKKAYEITVDSTKDHTASVAYANSILERWYAAGYRTLADVNAALEAYKKQKSGDSVDVDEFFEAALKRTYGG